MAAVNCSEFKPEMCGTTVEFAAYAVALPSLCVTGIVLNSMNLVVMTRPSFKMNDATHVYLRVMALVDVIAAVFMLGLGLTRCIRHSTVRLTIVASTYESFVLLPFANITITASVFITTIVCVERFVLVSSPAWGQRLCQRTYAKRLVVATIAVTAVLHLPYFFNKVVNDRGQIETSEFGRHRSFVIYSWCRLVIAKCLPILIIAGVNISLIRNVWKWNRSRKLIVAPDAVILQRRQRAQNRITGMLICISLMFLVGHSLEPFIHSPVYRSMFGPCATATPKYLKLISVVNVMESLSYAFNFMVYYAFNINFRECLKNICGCCRQKNHQVSRPPNPETVTGKPT